jgi:hypothetical protein
MTYLKASCPILFFLILTSFRSSAQSVKPIFKPFSLVEMFTSQGCSSCPPAHEIVDNIYMDPVFGGNNVLFLSFHVNYWDDLGWKDQFSKQEYTEHQRYYQDKFKQEGLYTPQFVVNGISGFSGNNEPRLRRELKASMLSQKRGPQQFEINSLSTEKNKLIFSYSALGENTDRLIQAAIISKSDTTLVNAGENANKELHSKNNVLNYLQIPMRVEGSKAYLNLPSMRKKSSLLFAVWVQSKLDAKVLDIQVFEIK